VPSQLLPCGTTARAAQPPPVAFGDILPAFAFREWEKDEIASD
jgi:hypothetical protein